MVLTHLEPVRYLFGTLPNMPVDLLILFKVSFAYLDLPAVFRDFISLVNSDTLRVFQISKRHGNGFGWQQIRNL
jgi:hypothetical protein